MGDLIRLELVADATQATGAIREVSQSAVSLNESLKATGTAGLEAGNQISEGMKRADFSMREAKGSAMLLGEEIGVKMNRHVAGFLAELPGVGAAMESAFSVLAVVAFAEILDRVVEKTTDWVVNTFIFTQAMKEADAEIVSFGKAMIAAEAFTHHAQESLARFGLNASQIANRDLSQLNDKLQENEAEMIRYKAQLDQAMAHPEQGGNVNQLSEQLRVAKEMHEGLLAEQRLYQDKVQKADADADAKLAKQREQAAKKEEEYVKRLQEEFKHFGEEQARAYAKGQRELEKLGTEHGNLLQQLKELSGVEAQEVVPALDKEIQKVTALTLARQNATHGLEGDLNRVISVQTLMTQGWKAFGMTAVQSLEQASIATLQHLAIALLTDDTMKISKAKLAAASAYSAEAGIPIIGPALGALAAAGAFAAIMAFEKGGIVPAFADGGMTDSFGPSSGSLAILHPNEMVLPAPISQTVQDMAASGLRGGGGDTHHYHISAMDAHSFKDFAKRNPEAFGAGMHKAVDRGHFNMSKAARGK